MDMTSALNLNGPYERKAFRIHISARASLAIPVGFPFQSRGGKYEI